MPAAIALFLLCIGSALAGQGPPASGTAEPLRKSDLVRMLTAGGLSKTEIADIVSRNCLSFAPTPRDRQDLRSVGADAHIMNRIDQCVRRSTAARVQVTPGTLAAAAGAEAVLEVTVRRGREPVGGARVVLRGSGALAGGPDRTAVTDDRGAASIRFPVGTRAATHRLTAWAEGAGETAIALTVSPGEPVTADVSPSRVETRPGAAPATQVTVAIRDRYGNGVPGQALSLGPSSATSDAQGQALITLSPAGLRRPARLAVTAGGRTLEGGGLEIAVIAPASADRTGFVAGLNQPAVVGNSLAEPLVLEVRDSAGGPVQGQMVALFVTNGRLDAASTTTDTVGRARIRPTVGPRVAPMVVTARVGNVEKQATFVPRPGPAVRLVVACGGGGSTLERRIDLASDTLLTLEVSARDRYGNPVAVAGLRAAVGDQRLMRVRETGADSSGVNAHLVLELRRPGATAFAILASGVRENFTVTVRPGRPAGPPCG